MKERIFDAAIDAACAVVALPFRAARLPLLMLEGGVDVLEAAHGFAHDLAEAIMWKDGDG